MIVLIQRQVIDARIDSKRLRNRDSSLMPKRRLNNFIVFFLVSFSLNILFYFIIIIVMPLVGSKFVAEKDLFFVLGLFVLVLTGAFNFEFEPIFFLLVELVKVFLSIAHVVALVPIIIFILVFIEIVIESREPKRIFLWLLTPRHAEVREVTQRSHILLFLLAGGLRLIKSQPESSEGPTF